MIDCVDIASAHLFGDALASQHRLRHRIFVQRRRWSVPAWAGMEFDEFDTPACTYFIWRDQTGEARGVSRVVPTEMPYMLQALWPSMVTVEPLPRDARVWEGSRIGIDRCLHPSTRRRVLGEIFCAYLEFGLRNGIDRYFVLLPKTFFENTVAKVGWPPNFLGPTSKFGYLEYAAASMDVSQGILDTVRTQMQIEGSVLRTADDLLRARAA